MSKIKNNLYYMRKVIEYEENINTISNRNRGKNYVKVSCQTNSDEIVIQVNWYEERYKRWFKVNYNNWAYVSDYLDQMLHRLYQELK